MIDEKIVSRVDGSVQAIRRNQQEDRGWLARHGDDVPDHIRGCGHAECFQARPHRSMDHVIEQGDGSARILSGGIVHIEASDSRGISDVMVNWREAHLVAMNILMVAHQARKGEGRWKRQLSGGGDP